MVASARAFSLVKYSIAPGVNVSGRVQLTKVGPPLAFKGDLHVSGGSASPGRLALGNGTLHGRLGNRNVGP